MLALLTPLFVTLVLSGRLVAAQCVGTFQFPDFKTSYTYTQGDNVDTQNVAVTLDPNVCNVESLSTQIAGELLVANTETLASAIYFNPTSSNSGVFVTTLTVGQLSAGTYQFIFQDGTSPYTTAYSPTFTINFVAPGQPTGAMKKRRIERELRGEQTPYGKQCSAGATSCHITGEIWDCIDIASDLEFCGGCPDTPESIDCTALPFVEGVGCDRGVCVVHSCQEGYRLSANATEERCVKV